MLDTRRPGKQVIDAMAQHNVFIGRIWPVMPTCVRTTIGTHDEMEQFQAAFQKVMHGTIAFSMPPAPPTKMRHRHGVVLQV
jgi:histidinol-phosphate aminotransferase